MSLVVYGGVISFTEEKFMHVMQYYHIAWIGDDDEKCMVLSGNVALI